MNRRILTKVLPFVVALTLVVPAAGSATARSLGAPSTQAPAGFCDSHPTHWRCQPTPTPTPAPSTTPTPVPPTPSPTATVAPTPSSTVTETIADGSTISGVVNWESTVSVSSASEDFNIDGSTVWTEHYLPYQYGGDQAAGAFDTSSLTDGAHTFAVVAKDGAGSVVGSASASVVVSNSAPSPSITPSPTVTPTPSIAPTPTPTPGDPWATPFGARPQSGPINLTGAACNGITISNLTFADFGAGTGGRAITLTNCSNVVIEQVDFINVAEGIIAHGGSNITVRDSRYQNILGPAHNPDGSRPANVGNFVQFDNVNGGLVDHNKGRCGDTEDIVSLTGATNNVTASNNWFEGALSDGPGCLAWKSNSGSGIAVADGSGHDNAALNNVVVNPGQVGIFISGGANSRIDGNIIIGETRPLANVGGYVQSNAGAACNDTFTNNRVNWSNASGSANPFFDWGDGCFPDTSGSTISGRDTTVSPSAYHVAL